MKFAGQNIKESGIRKEWKCDIIGIKRNGYPLIFPDVHFIVNCGDQIWLLGDNKMVMKLIKAGLIQDETFAGNPPADAAL
jgi:CPA2 family monovalent cation:H+ antiporter-2